MENLQQIEARIKAVGELPISSTAKAIGFAIAALGTACPKKLIEATGFARATLYRALAEYHEHCGYIPTSLTSPTCPTSEIPTRPNDGNCSQKPVSLVPPVGISEPVASRVRANTEIPTGLVITKNLESHSHTEQAAERARVGEEEIAPGLFVNCKTIRHRAFAINVDAVRMASQAAGWTKDETKDFCVANAMQWATEIDNGKLPREVVPDKIANFLGASIMGAKNRKAAADTRATHKGGRPSTSDMIGRALARREAAI